MAGTPPPGPPDAGLDDTLDDSRIWLGIAALAVGVVYLVYLATHTHPAYEGGLFLDIARRLVADQYTLPERIAGYTTDGVPFAYPPLLFYVMAGIVAGTGVDAVTLQLMVPGLVIIATLVPFYYIAHALLGSTRQAGLATVIYGVAPAVLRWHISAGGIVRAPAMLLALTGVYCGLRLFRDGNRRWLMPAMVLFGLTVVAHPHYTAFFGLTYLVWFWAFDRTPRGLGMGGIVAGGGFILAAPWWVTVARLHGPGVFLAASGSHGGLLGGLPRLWGLFVVPIAEADVLSVLFVAVLAGAVTEVLRRRYLIPAWMVLSGYVIGKDRFVFVAGAMLISVLVWSKIYPAVYEARRGSISFPRGLPTGGNDRGRSLPDGGERPPGPAIAVAVTVVLCVTLVGALFAGSALATAHEHSSTLPQTVDSDDRAAMQWLRDSTADNATLLVMGDAAEWYPYYTNRSIVVSPWGLEWTSSERYYDEVELFQRVSTCRHPSCVQLQVGVQNRTSDYVVVPIGEYTVRGQEYWGTTQRVEAFADSERYQLVYQNDGAAVFRTSTVANDAGRGWRYPSPF